MSGVNLGYKIAGGGEGIHCFEEKTLHEIESSNLSNIIADEIVNEIIENAVDIATNGESKGDHCTENEQSRNNNKQSVDLPPLYDAKTIQNKEATSLNANTVGDVESNVPHMPSNIKEIIDGLSKVYENHGSSNLENDLEMKTLLTEMISAITFSAREIPIDGVGDQLKDGKSYFLADSVIVDLKPNKNAEKKSRVANLTMNSPRLITEYLTMDEIAKQNQDLWEESNEKLIQDIELDYPFSDEDTYKVANTSTLSEYTVFTENNDECDLSQISTEDIMDIVDLNSQAFQFEENQLCINADNYKIKNDHVSEEGLEENFFSIVENSVEETTTENITFPDKHKTDPNNSELKKKK